MLLSAAVFVCLGAVLYSYLLYPFALALWAGIAQVLSDARYIRRKGDRRSRGAANAELPAVAVVIAAYNEERHIKSRIENLLSLDYPAHLLTVFVGSDGSKDRTASIMAGFDDPRLKLIAFEQNRGKASVLNDLVARAEAPILVFSDANTYFHEQALRRLVSHFDDADVGVVSGELRLKDSAGDNQDSLYWRVEQFLKFFEARIGGLLGANGAIYAIRRPLWKPLTSDTICDDFCVAMNIAAQKHKLVYEPEAWAEEDTPDSIDEEFKRRVRIGIGNFQALVRHPEYVLRTSTSTAFTYVSHKVLRWLAPHLLLIALLASAALAWSSDVWRLLLALQVGAYALAGFLYLISRRGGAVRGVLRIPAFLFALNWAFLVASFRFASGQYSGSWRRTSR